MRKYILDTNCLLRYFLNDNKEQSGTTEKYLLLAKEGKISLNLPIFIFFECVFILTKLYKLEKNTVIEKLLPIATSAFLNIDNRKLIIYSLKLYAIKNISFVDACFYMQSVIEGKELLTFDKKLKMLQIPKDLLQD